VGPRYRIFETDHLVREAAAANVTTVGA